MTWADIPAGRGVLAGVVATIAMDIGATLLRLAGLTAGVTPAILGKWFAAVLHGQPVHADIRTAAIEPLPLPVVVLMHYAIGAALGVGFVALAAWLGVPRPRWPYAILYGFATNALPWLVMFPAMGFGVCGLAGPAELLLFRSSLLNHLCWGAGLALFLLRR